MQYRPVAVCGPSDVSVDIAGFCLTLLPDWVCHCVLCSRFQVVAELQQRSKQVAFEAAALTSQRQQLAALDAQRRAALRVIEDSLSTAGAQLDDRAKEEKLRQIRLAEEAYQVGD